MDFRLPSGKRLGDANRAELFEAADYYGKMAEASFRKARWLEARAQDVDALKASLGLVADK
jgi:hypothetical protein